MKFAFKSLVTNAAIVTLVARCGVYAQAEDMVNETDSSEWSIQKNDLDFIGEADMVNDTFMNIIKDGSKCIYQIVNQNGINEEMQKAITKTQQNSWLNAIESGSQAEIVQAMGQAIDPLTNKLLGTAGGTVAKGMSMGLINWMRDSALLWIK